MGALQQSEGQGLKLSGAVDGKDINNLRIQGDRMITRAGDRIILDLGELETVSSIVLSLLLVWMKRAQSLGKVLVIRNIPDRLFDMARVGGLELILQIERD